jgi:site-specific DNA-methyltransferase (adenine-specific)
MLEFNKIYNMDCLEGLKKLSKGSVSLIYADMMYDDLNFSWIDECYRVLKSDGSIYVQTDQRSVAQLKLYMDKMFKFRNWIVWCYRGISRRSKCFQLNHDDILFYTKSDNFTWIQPFQSPSDSTLKRWGKYADDSGNVPLDKLTPSMRKKGKTMSIRNTRMRDWWDDISVVGFKEASKGKLHIFQKPIELVKRIILASSNPQDLVLDPFVGSGTTAVACKQMARNFIGFEISKDYCDIANKRLEQETLTSSIPPTTKVVGILEATL